VTDQDIQLLIADLAIIIVLARLLGAAAKRIGQPQVLGEIVAGILLGPTLFDGKITATLFPPALLPPLTALATIGLLLFMFIVGYEVDLRLIRGRERVAASVSVCSIILPLTLGILLALWLAGRHHMSGVGTFALFFGIAMSVTAFPVLARILADRGLHRTRIGGLALASAAVDDVIAWSLLAILVAVAGAGGHQARLLLAPLYVVAMILLVRPLLKRLAGIYRRQGRLTPTVLAVVLVGLLLSCYATEWMGIKYIFGAFAYGLIMPREGVADLRQDILERLEQVSVLVLLPVFFVVAGLKVNLSGIGLSGLAELGLILLVAIAGKFGGAFAGGRLAGVRPRQAGVLAALMNTRGLTEIVILSVGLQLRILPASLYTLMIVMAIGTTAMAGPLVKLFYPAWLMRRDLAEADRARLGVVAGHRVVVLIGRPDAAGPLVDVAVALAASRANSELILTHLVAHPDRPLEVGTGLGSELLQMTGTMGELQELAQRGTRLGVPTVVYSRFSEDVARELPGFVAAVEPHTVVLASGETSTGASTEASTADGAAAEAPFRAGGSTQLVTMLRDPPAAPTAVAVHWARGADGAAALQVAAQLAAASQLGLVLTPGGGRPASVAADLTRRGLAACAGPAPGGALLVAAGDQGDGSHLAVLAGTSEASDDLDQWIPTLEGSKRP
jgi:Kef-type K+ transport system membrane component KefB